MRNKTLRAAAATAVVTIGTLLASAGAAGASTGKECYPGVDDRLKKGYCSCDLRGTTGIMLGSTKLL